MNRRFSPAIGRRRRRRAFTLIEMTVAVSLLGIVVLSGATLMLQVTAARTRAQRMAEHYAQADAAINSIALALRNTFRHIDEAHPFIGTQEMLADHPANRLTFFTIDPSIIRPGQPESDVKEVEFFLQINETAGTANLMRRTDPTLNLRPDGGGVVDRLAQGVIALQFNYFDGGQWLMEWPEMLQALPEAVRVRVTVVLDAERGTSRSYSRLVHLPLKPGDAQGQGPDEGVGERNREENTRDRAGTEGARGSSDSRRNGDRR